VRKKSVDSGTKRVSKIIAGGSLGLIVIIAVIAVYMDLPQAIVAAVLPKQSIENRAPKIIEIQNVASGIKEVEAEASAEPVNQEKLVKVDEEKAVTAFQPIKEVKLVKVEPNKTPDQHEEVDVYVEGTDLRNDPNFQEELRTIYVEEDIERLYAERRWVTMPNVVGMTEADAIRTLRSAGIVGRVTYQDQRFQRKADGVCYAQDSTPGRMQNTDASVFIWVQRTEKLPYEQPVKEELKAAEPVVKPSVKEEVKPAESVEKAESSQAPPQNEAPKDVEDKQT
jgi:hypothetical protein